MCVYRSTILHRRLDVKRIIIFMLTAAILLSMVDLPNIKTADGRVFRQLQADLPITASGVLLKIRIIA